MGKTWGKAAHYVRMRSSRIVDSCPQITKKTTTRTIKTVHNVTFPPTYPDIFPSFFPQAKSSKMTLLINRFSPLSTSPITITTNLKS